MDYRVNNWVNTPHGYGKIREAGDLGIGIKDVLWDKSHIVGIKLHPKMLTDCGFIPIPRGSDIYYTHKIEGIKIMVCFTADWNGLYTMRANNMIFRLKYLHEFQNELEDLKLKLYIEPYID